MKLKLALVTLALSVMPTVADATSYDLVGDFGSSVFSYGTGTGGVSFTAFANSYAGGCFGNASFACFTNGSSGTVPVAGQYSGAGTFSLGTPAVPNDVVFLHPDQGGLGTDVIVRFTAATAGAYKLDGLFERVDSANGAGNGVTAKIFQNIGGATTQLFSGSVSTDTYLNSTAFSKVATLGAGDTIDSVPEPAGWALMIGGFGLVGGALRVRSRKVCFA